MQGQNTYEQSLAENRNDGKLDAENSSVWGNLAPTVSFKQFFTPTSCFCKHSTPPSATNTTKRDNMMFYVFNSKIYQLIRQK